jgi:hypothetical protein
LVPSYLLPLALAFSALINASKEWSRKSKEKCDTKGNKREKLNRTIFSAESVLVFLYNEEWSEYACTYMEPLANECSQAHFRTT